MLSALYGAIVRWRNRRYDQGRAPVYRAPVPVISVGNLSTGGTGKTPMTEELLHRLLGAGWHRPAYLSRGYGRATRGYRLVQPDQDSAREVGDEALQVAHRFAALPVAVCADRAEGIRRLVAEAGASCIVLDDAFQHRRVARDLDLVMVDANRLPTTDRLLPAGRLREPLSSLQRASLVVVNKVADPADIPRLAATLAAPGRALAFCTPEAQTLHGPDGEKPLDQLRGQTVVLFAGIGNPGFFARQMRALGAEVVAERFFRDHHRYRTAELARLASTAHAAGAWLLTTEKDWYRLQAANWPPAFPLYHVRIGLRWLVGEDKLAAALARLPLLPPS